MKKVTGVRKAMSFHTIFAKPHSIRTWLRWLVVACVLPGIFFDMYLIYDAYQQQKISHDQATINITRALSQMVDRELADLKGTAQTLASSPLLHADKLAEFYAQAKEALNDRPENNIIVSDINGQQLLNTLRPFGAALPRHPNQTQLTQVFETGRAAVSDLFVGIDGKLRVSVDIPVRRDGKMIYVLSLAFLPRTLIHVFRNNPPTNWIASILDGGGVVLMRSQKSEQFVGSKAPQQLLQRIRQFGEDTMNAETLDGIPVRAAFSHSVLSNWTAVVGIPRKDMETALYSSTSLAAGGEILSLILGLMLARWIDKHISGSFHGLATPVMALGTGAALELPALPVKEANDLGKALEKAAELIRVRTVERDRAETAEQEIRLINQQLAESEAFRRAIFEVSPIAVLLVAESGRIMLASREAETLFGYATAQLLALKVEDLMPPETRPRHPALRATFHAQPKRRAMGKEKHLLGRRADGTAFPVDIMLSPLRVAQGETMVIAAVRDMSEQRRAEAALTALNTRLTLATEAGQMSIWEWDPAGAGLILDKRLFAQYKIAEETGPGAIQALRRYVQADDLRDLEREIADALTNNKPISTEFRIVLASGQIRTIRADAIVTRDAAGKVSRITGINWDVSDSRQQQKINAALREKETLLKELYHRVKNNLQVITSLFNLQARSMPAGASRVALLDAAERVRAMALVHEKFYQSENLSSIALDGYIADLCRQLGNSVGDQRGIVLVTEAQALQVGLETAVPLGLILNELIANCLKHAFPEGKKYPDGRIVARLARDADMPEMAILSVSDNGIGFPSGFDRTACKTLGLKLVAGLTEQLDGEFTLGNQDGAYAQLRFRLSKKDE